ncbi:MAG: M23 family metallopeptidase, partial [Candidatus Roizmanbacteria bacterium]|nr:M23 family metallopeptidase [Candidatus Roizmanbacteria bacterium]
MAYHHMAHLDSFDKHIKKGVKIKRGDPVGKVGNTSTRYAHLHYEVMRIKPDKWIQYTAGLSKEQVETRYADPNKWIDKGKKIPAPYTTYEGWEYLDVINRSGQLHPGVDINDKYGNDDKGNQILSPCLGEVVHIGEDNGWGKHIWIYEDENDEHPLIDWDFARSVAGRMFLQVEAHGEAWYVDTEAKRHYIGANAEDMLDFVRKQA